MNQDDWSARSQALAALISRVALGDRAAFASLYRETAGHLFAVVLRIQTDRGQAEELLQDVYVSVWRAAQGFDARRAQPMTWMIAIARHRAIDSLRRVQAAPRTVTLGDGDDGDGTDPLDRLQSEGAGPLDLLQGAVERREITRCVGELTPAQRQCVALTYYQGLSHAEVAEQLSRPLGTVKAWVRRALLALRDCLAREERAGEVC